MGGKAFSSGSLPLSTPRMPPGMYYNLRDHYLDLLAKYFEKVATPLEAPSKSSYGDIDILVAQPRLPISEPQSHFISQMLSAARVTKLPHSGAASYAVPYPDTCDEYVQIDIHICPLSTYDWHLFHQSHGDLWNLLGTTIRPFGLTANDKGLHLRIAEIEELDRKKSGMILTSEPDQVLALLGLDKDRYWRPFQSVETMFQYVVGCQFFRIETYTRASLKANDRKRIAQRDLYRQFVNDWVPENEGWIRTSSEREPALMRNDVMDLVLPRFDKRAAYDQKIGEWRKARRDLLSKQGNRESRKAEAARMEEYADAWIVWLKDGK